jgi:hypothetical protein
MSSSSETAGSNPALTARVEALERETEALAAALAGAQRSRLMITLLFVAFVAVAITAFYRQGKQLTEERYLSELRALGEKSLNEHQKQYLGQLEKLAREVEPKVTEAFYSQAKRDFPAYLNKFGSERDTLVANLQRRLDTSLTERFDQSLKQSEALLKEEFPLADKPEMHERMMRNVGLALERLSKKYYADQLNVQLFALFDAWDAFPAAPKPLPGEVPLEDQLIGTLLEILSERLKNTEKGVLADS